MPSKRTYRIRHFALDLAGMVLFIGGLGFACYALPSLPSLNALLMP